MNKKLKVIIQIVIFILALLIFAGIYHILTSDNSIEEQQIQGISEVNNINEENNIKEENKMGILTFSNDNFEQEVLKSEVPVLVDFYADWCGPCKMMSPIVESISQELGETAKVGKVNIDENQELAITYNVMSIPTLIIFEQGKVVKTFIGVQDKATILKEFK